MSDTSDMLAACERFGAQTPVVIEMDIALAITLIAVIQLASRHPAATGSTTIQSTIRLARGLQDQLASREPELGRLLERGWHQVFDRVARSEEFPRQ